MSEKEEKQYEAFGWDKRKYEPARHGKKTKERLEWIHSKLPLTQAERDSLIYAAKHSELKTLGNEYLESLLQLENDSGLVAKKEARNPNRRQRKIAFSPPEPGDEVPADVRPVWDAVYTQHNEPDIPARR